MPCLLLSQYLLTAVGMADKHHSSAEKPLHVEGAATPSDPETSNHQRFAKDESVLARFGKRQQLRVCVHSLNSFSLLSFTVFPERFRPTFRHRFDQYVDVDLGGSHSVRPSTSQVILPISKRDTKDDLAPC